MSNPNQLVKAIEIINTLSPEDLSALRDIISFRLGRDDPDAELAFREEIEAQLWALQEGQAKIIDFDDAVRALGLDV